MPTRRNVLLYGTAFTALPVLARLGLSQTPSTTVSRSHDPFDYVNPEFRPALKWLAPMLESAPPLSAATLAANRQGGAQDFFPAQPRPAITERTIPGPAGNPKLRVFVIGDSPGASKPAILHIHGGGYVAGTAATEHRLLQEMVTNLDCVVVTVDYRLAPETKFPGSLEDNYAALHWMNTNAKELGIDIHRIAVKGESAGGGHAATLAIAARDRGEFSICHQVLIYPMLDDRTGSTTPVPPYIGHFIWTVDNNRFGWTSLLGVPAGSKDVPVNSVPARVANLEGLPPAFIGVGSIDLFASEDLEYSRRLLEAGVPAEFVLVPGGFHGFDLISSNALLSVQFKNAWMQALRRAFASKAA
jgi:acetyl esterase/lipase